ncbi:MAG: anti-sigma factor [Janthinobacterium lividum]
MNLHRDPALLDSLAAEYALGTLRGAARRRLEALGLQDQGVRSAIDLWTRRLQSLPELAGVETPSPAVWQTIAARLGLTGYSVPQSPVRNADEPQQHNAPQPSYVRPWPPKRLLGLFDLDNLSFWRGWAAVATAAAIVALAFALRPLLPTNTSAPVFETRVSYVAALHDENQRTVMLLTWDEAHGTMTVRRLADFPLRSDQSLQLWGLGDGSHPVSLGVLPRGGAQLAMQVSARPRDFGALAISVEPKGGSPNPQGPSGPVIWSGKLVSAS